MNLCFIRFDIYFRKENNAIDKVYNTVLSLLMKKGVGFTSIQVCVYNIDNFKKIMICSADLIYMYIYMNFS